MGMLRLLCLLACLASAFAWLDFYEIMQLQPPTTKSAVKKAFRARALELHPDKNDKPDAEARFRDLVTGK
jgi:DnaJ-class molecular chaperone